MSDMTPVDKSSSLWRAWRDYMATEDYENTRKWARVDYHTDGSLWAAFEAGFRAATPIRTPKCVDQNGMSACGCHAITSNLPTDQDEGGSGMSEKKRCAVCGNNLGDDLFASVTGEKCCSICKLKYIGGLPTSDERIASVRAALGLQPGQYLQQDNGAEATRILGRSR